MDRQELIRNLEARFNADVATFLYDVRSAVSGYISGCGAGCLTLIERTSSGPSVWTLRADPQYAMRLVAFCRGKTYNGNALDSGLTEPVVGIVTRQFEMLYQSKDEEIARSIIDYVLSDQVLSKGLVSTIIGSAAAHHATQAAKQKVAALLIEELRHLVHAGAGQTLLASVGHAVAAATAKPIAAKIAMLLMKAMTLHMKAIIAKVLASAAIKALIATAVKKVVFAAVAAVVIKTVAMKLGISAGAVWMWVLIPLIAALLYREVVTFPQHLGEKVADKVVEDLIGGFPQVNHDVLERLVDDVLGAGIGAIAMELGQSQEVQDAIEELLGSLV